MEMYLKGFWVDFFNIVYTRFLLFQCAACHSFLENSVFFENQFFRLSCQSSFGATCTWKFDNQIIFDGKDFSSRFSKCQIFQNGSHCELTAAKARLTYGGLYHCEIIMDDVNQRSTFAAHVVVLESNPICFSSSNYGDALMEGDFFKAQCSVHYSGDWPPIMDVETETDSVGKQDIIISHSPGHNLTLSLLRKLTSDDHGSVFIFKTFFQPLNHSGDHATNIPNYGYMWNTSHLNVFYKPRKVIVTPSKDVFYPGELLTCSAISNPEAALFWTNVETGRVYNVSSLLTNESMIRERKHDYICSAVVDIPGMNMSWWVNKSVQFVVVETRGESFFFITGFTLAGCVIASIVIVYFMYRRIKFQAKSSRKKESVIIDRISRHTYDEILEISKQETNTGIVDEPPYANMPVTAEMNPDDCSPNSTDMMYTGLNLRSDPPTSETLYNEMRTSDTVPNNCCC